MIQTGDLLMAKYETDCLMKLYSDLIDRMEKELNTYGDDYLREAEHAEYKVRVEKMLDVKTSLTRAKTIKRIIDMVNKEISKSQRRENGLTIRFEQFCKRNNLNPEEYGLKQ